MFTLLEFKPRPKPMPKVDPRWFRYARRARTAPAFQHGLARRLARTIELDERRLTVMGLSTRRKRHDWISTLLRAMAAR